MKSINLVFGIHNHKPLGCADSELEEAYQKSDKSYLSILHEFEDIPVTLHFSGILLEWLENKHPEYFVLLREMLKNKQVELIGGGYFDPILTMIPLSDKLGQIELLTTYIRANFGNRPRGIWLTEQEWEQGLAQVLTNCGMEYLFLEDTIFKLAGLDSEDLYYSCLTEDQGKIINAIPICKELNTMAFHKKPREVIRYIKDRGDKHGNRVICFFEDGENWIKGDAEVNSRHKQEWLRKFLMLLRANRHYITPIHAKAYIGNLGRRKKIYLPDYSSSLVQKWIMNRGNTTGMFKSSYYQVRGFKNFFSRYPESNLMYSKMLYTHILVNQVRGDKYRKKASREELWKAQCNFAYWPGKFLGIYSNPLRKEVYRNMIASEKGTRTAGIFLTSIIATDFDMDGENEYLYQGSVMNVYLHNRGGAVFELDYIPAYWNYLDTVARTRELYHIPQDWRYCMDWYTRNAFLDHFIDTKTTIDDFDGMLYNELGSFINYKYDLEELDREKNIVVFKRQGSVKTKRKQQAVLLRKKYCIKKNSIQVSYTITNMSEEALYTRFAVECNLSLVSHERKDVHFCVPRGKGLKRLDNTKSEILDIDKIAIQDRANGVSLSLHADKKFNLWCLPVETVYREKKAITKLYQFSCFLPAWDLSLDPGEEWSSDLVLSISKLKTTQS
ncbi:MAG: DUF1926 domain-containing protein [Spirochaetia bacterium]